MDGVHSHSHAFSSDGTVFKSAFSLQDSIFRWEQPDGKGSDLTLTYSYSNLFDGAIGGGITNQEMKSAIEESFSLWAQYAPLNFVEVSDTGEKSFSNPDAADIRFGHREMDGSGGTLAEAVLTYFGDLAVEIDFDNQDAWEVDWIGPAFDFVSVAVHEIGHALGLKHEFDVDAIMNPFASDIYAGLGTAFVYADDIAGIRALYGRGQGSLTTLEPEPVPQPDPTPQPDPQPDPVPDPSMPIWSNAKVVSGTWFDDVIIGGRRSQTIEGLNGNDLVSAGSGNDVVMGGKGYDQLFGEGNEDLLFGGANNDFLDGGGGDDELIGGLGDDELIGGLGNDSLMGGKGQDILLGTSIDGDGLREKDALVGGAKADLFILGDRTRAFYDDGSSGTVGLADHALILDFKGEEGDQIQLHGKAADYSIGAVPGGESSEQGIFLKTAGKDELIGIVRSNSLLVLESESFVFV
ncbi:MAG: matrixin family metalloprotease [Cyanobacteria bacterium P01_D01_bin.1]